MRKRLSLSLVALMVGAALSCSSGPTTESATLDNISFSVPSGWQSQSLSDLYTRRVSWTPIDNEAKESIVVVRSAKREAQTKAGLAYAARLLDETQAALLAPRFSKPREHTTKTGLIAVRVDGTFLPPTVTERYTRHHAVLIDESTWSFVHVIYTAKVPDPDTFELVLDSLSLEGN